MKLNSNLLAPFFLAAILFSSCTSSDPVTPVAPTSGFVCIKSPNANTLAGDCNTWKLTYEAPGFSAPNVLRSDSFAPDLMTLNVTNKQCSAYHKASKTLLVGIGDRIIKYQYGPTAASSTPSASPPVTYLGSNVQALEYVGNRLFIIKNNNLKELDPSTLAVLTTFATVPIPVAGHISNMSTFGTNLYFINGSTLYSVDTSLTSPALNVITTGLSPSASGVLIYDGLEVKDATTFYAVNNDNSSAGTKKFVKITSSGATTEITGLPIPSNYNRLSSVYDPITEYYYGISYNLTTNTSTIYAIDITPLSGPLTASPVTISDYVFGLQLKD